MDFGLTGAHANPELAAASRGFHATFRDDAENRCPGCGGSQWHVGRFSAECGFCGTALPFARRGFAAPRKARRR